VLEAQILKLQQMDSNFPLIKGFLVPSYVRSIS
jgi:hypothetical protein